jgi:hypothetical protein
LRARLIRRTLRRLAQMIRYRRATLADVPILFANSFPKSGTHLLTQVLQGFTALGPAVDSGLPAVVMYDGYSGKARLERKIAADLKRFLPADIGFGHLHAIPPAVSFMSSPGTAAYFILRDPRDVAVSHVHYITDLEPRHVHHRYYVEELHNFDERLRVSILGRTEMDVSFPGIDARFTPFLGWLDRSQVMVIRYEDFITDRANTMRGVVAHAVKAGFPLYERDPQRIIEIMEAAINPQRSPTFRRGRMNAWKEDFSMANKRLFKESAGDLLIRLGYERDYDW